ncbi:hypothetical protein ABZ621_10425 [Streptomyces sp. NPDC007863]|uniref:hypothetical protein n=1 Tax=Streptomyces sp. NPDC007863 TaxID=3154894 RepID=UPI0033EF6ABF
MPRPRTAWSPVVLSALVVALCSIGLAKGGAGHGTSGPAGLAADSSGAVPLDLGWD